VVAAVASGAGTLEAAAVVTESATVDAASLASVADLGGPGTPVVLAGPDAAVRATLTA
jgi:hypothetical protein